MLLTWWSNVPNTRNSKTVKLRTPALDIRTQHKTPKAEQDTGKGLNECVVEGGFQQARR
jgi:hypothetical protein